MGDENKPIEAVIVSESPAPTAVPRASEGPVSVATASASGATDTGQTAIKKHKGWPKGKPRKTAFQRLDSRKQKFVLEVLNGRSQTEAAALAGYSTKSNGALRVQGTNLMNNPKVQNALQEKLDALYPNLNEKVATKLAEIMEMPLREGPHSPGVSISEFLATARFLQDVYGWKAPAKSIRANVKVDATKRLLPSD